MKKTLSVMFYALCCTFITVSYANAQTALASLSSEKVSASPSAISADKNDAAGDVKRDELNSAKSDLKTSKAKFKMMKAQYRANENFKKEFEDGPDVSWSVGEVIHASFERDGTRTAVMYDKQGNWFHTLLYYSEDQMPSDVRSRITSAYPAYSITGVQEIKEGDVTFYIVHIADKTTFKYICVYNNEMYVYKDFNKQVPH